jgi:hypothetical protein
MSQLDIRKKDTLPKQVYYDIVITNVKSETTDPPILQFNENRANPIIQNTGEYYLSIIRFQVDSTSLPIFIPEIQTGQSDPNKTIYSVTLEYLGTAVQTYLVWVPQNQSVQTPPPPSSQPNGLQAFSEYYYAYNYQALIYMIYNALQTCFDQLVIATGGASSPIYTAHAPVITWDSQSNTAVISAESAFYNRGVPALVPNPITLYFNASLFNLFSSFPTRYEGITGVTLGRNYIIEIFQDDTNTIYLPVSAPSVDQYVATQLQQEYSTTATWTPISSIVFCSNTLPIVSNMLSAPLVYNDGRIVQALSGNNANFAQIITDLASNDNNYKPNLLYEPSAQYRYIDMFGNQPLTNIDVSVFWKSKLGILVPFKLNSGSSCSLKFLFQRKDSI